MDFKKVVESKKELKAKDNSELAKIYADHDGKKWTAEDFEAIRQILQERGQSVPHPTGTPPSPSQKRQAVSRDLSKYEGIKGWLLFLCISLKS